MITVHPYVYICHCSCGNGRIACSPCWLLSGCSFLRGTIGEGIRQGLTASTTQRKTLVSVCRSALKRLVNANAVQSELHGTQTSSAIRVHKHARKAASDSPKI